MLFIEVSNTIGEYSIYKYSLGSSTRVREIKIELTNYMYKIIPLRDKIDNSIKRYGHPLDKYS
jgi:hypothetical protein